MTKTMTLDKMGMTQSFSDSPINMIFGNKITGNKFEVAKDHFIYQDAGDILTIIVPALSNVQWNGSNLAAKYHKVFEFKHSRRNGSKFYTLKPGIEYYFFVPKSKIEVVLEKHYSYVKVILNGVETFFNVSGYSGDGIWTDFIGQEVGTMVQKNKKLLNAINEIALNPVYADMPTISVKEQEQKDLDDYTNDYLQTIAAKYMKSGMKVVPSTFVAFCDEANIFELSFQKIKGVFVYLTKEPHQIYKVRKEYINWKKTFEANQLLIPEIKNMNRTLTKIPV